MSKKKENHQTKRERKIGFGFGVSVGLASAWIAYGINSSWSALRNIDWASWVQAIGTIVAIGSGFYLNMYNQKQEQLREIDGVLNALKRLDEILGQGVLVAVYQERGKNFLDAQKKSKDFKPGHHMADMKPSGYSVYFEEKGFRQTEFFFLVNDIRSKQFLYLDPILKFKIQELVDELEHQENRIDQLLKKHKASDVISSHSTHGAYISSKLLVEVIESLTVKRASIRAIF